MAKRLTDEERQCLEAASKVSISLMEWYYDSIKLLRNKLKPNGSKIANVIKEANSKNGNGGFYSLKDICKVLNWTMEKNKNERTELQTLSSTIAISTGISHSDSAKILFEAIPKVLKKDYEHVTDLLLTGKEVKKSKKRRRIEKKHGEKRKLNTFKTEDEKKEARKERTRVRKEAKKLGISTKEYKSKAA